MANLPQALSARSKGMAVQSKAHGCGFIGSTSRSSPSTHQEWPRYAPRWTERDFTLTTMAHQLHQNGYSRHAWRALAPSARTILSGSCAAPRHPGQIVRGRRPRRQGLAPVVCRLRPTGACGARWPLRDARAIPGPGGRGFPQMATGLSVCPSPAGSPLCARPRLAAAIHVLACPEGRRLPGFCADVRCDLGATRRGRRRAVRREWARRVREWGRLGFPWTFPWCMSDSKGNGRHSK